MASLPRTASTTRLMGMARNRPRPRSRPRLWLARIEQRAAAQVRRPWRAEKARQRLAAIVVATADASNIADAGDRFAAVIVGAAAARRRINGETFTIIVVAA